MGDTWIEDPGTKSLGDPLMEMHHLDGVAWYEAPIPHKLHRCKPQTHALYRFEIVDRCACGALRYDGRGVWITRNSRQRERRQAHALKRALWGRVK